MNNEISKNHYVVLMNITQFYINMSGLLDRKSTILITANSIAISVILSSLILEFSANEYLIIPTFIFGIGSLSSLIFAFLASKNFFTRRKLKALEPKKKQNLLLLGYMPEKNIEHFKNNFYEIISDYEYLLDSLADNLFLLKRDFNRKNSYLNISYNIIILNYVVSITALIYAYLFV